MVKDAREIWMALRFLISFMTSAFTWFVVQFIFRKSIFYEKLFQTKKKQKSHNCGVKWMLLPQIAFDKSIRWHVLPFLEILICSRYQICFDQIS